MEQRNGRIGSVQEVNIEGQELNSLYYIVVRSHVLKLILFVGITSKFTEMLCAFGSLDAT